MIFDVNWRKRTSQCREIGLANMLCFVIEGHGGQQGAVLSHSPQNVLMMAPGVGRCTLRRTDRHLIASAGASTFNALYSHEAELADQVGEGDCVAAGPSIASFSQCLRTFECERGLQSLLIRGGSRFS